MLTIKAEVLPGKQRVDSSYNVKLRFTLNRHVKRLSTSLFAKPGDLSKDLKLREGTDIKKQAEELIASYYNKCARLQIELHSYSINDCQVKMNSLKPVPAVPCTQNYSSRLRYTTP